MAASDCSRNTYSSTKNTTTTSSISTSHIILELLQERNRRETLPFVAIHESNARLLNQVDALQAKLAASERDAAACRQELLDNVYQQQSYPQNTNSGIGGSSERAAQAALKNEVRLREKLETLQEELHRHMTLASAQQTAALQTTQDLSAMKDRNTVLEQTVYNLTIENERAEHAIAHLTKEVAEAQSRTDLAEKQYDGLKRTIRLLQEENDTLVADNRKLEARLVSDKGQSADEMNALTDMVHALKVEVDMLRSYKVQEDQRKSWFRGSSGNNNHSLPTSNAASSPSTPSQSKIKNLGEEEQESKESQSSSPSSSSSRKWGTFGVILPTSPKHIVSAHAMEGTCIRYNDESDGNAGNLIATASSDSTVKVFDTSSGARRATLRGTTGHSVLGCDIAGSFVVGGGTDKTCRVWNVRTERMIHHLVGHQQKVTCVRFFGAGGSSSSDSSNHNNNKKQQQNVISGSADRSLKVWDISRKTYLQSLTVRYGSGCNCVDVAADGVSAVSGHLDGGVRFWDLRSGNRTAELSAIHKGAITSVQFQSSSTTNVLTNSMDHSLKWIDVRTGTAMHTFRHADFTTSYGWSAACISPGGGGSEATGSGGPYVIAGSNSTGDLFVWSTLDGTLKAQLCGHHTSGVCAVHWSRGGSNGQQVASIDRSGMMILWA